MLDRSNIKKATKKIESYYIETHSKYSKDKSYDYNSEFVCLGSLFTLTESFSEEIDKAKSSFDIQIAIDEYEKGWNQIKREQRFPFDSIKHDCDKIIKEIIEATNAEITKLKEEEIAKKEAAKKPPTSLKLPVVEEKYDLAVTNDEKVAQLVDHRQELISSCCENIFAFAKEVENKKIDDKDVLYIHKTATRKLSFEIFVERTRKLYEKIKNSPLSISDVVNYIENCKKSMILKGNNLSFIKEYNKIKTALEALKPSLIQADEKTFQQDQKIEESKKEVTHSQQSGELQDSIDDLVSACTKLFAYNIKNYADHVKRKEVISAQTHTAFNFQCFTNALENSIRQPATSSSDVANAIHKYEEEWNEMKNDAYKKEVGKFFKEIKKTAEDVMNILKKDEPVVKPTIPLQSQAPNKAPAKQSPSPADTKDDPTKRITAGGLLGLVAGAAVAAFLLPHVAVFIIPSLLIGDAIGLALGYTSPSIIKAIKKHVSPLRISCAALFGVGGFILGSIFPGVGNIIGASVGTALGFALGVGIEKAINYFVPERTAVPASQPRQKSNEEKYNPSNNQNTFKPTHLVIPELMPKSLEMDTNSQQPVTNMPAASNNSVIEEALNEYHYDAPSDSSLPSYRG